MTVQIFDRNRRCLVDPKKPARNRNLFHSNENEMIFNSMVPIAKQLKSESGTRYSVRYLIKYYETPEALQSKLNWLRGCNGSIG